MHKNNHNILIYIQIFINGISNIITAFFSDPRAFLAVAGCRFRRAITGLTDVERVLNRPFTTETPLRVVRALSSAPSTTVFLAAAASASLDELQAALVKELGLPSPAAAARWKTVHSPALTDALAVIRSVSVFKAQVEALARTPFSAADNACVNIVTCMGQQAGVCTHICDFFADSCRAAAAGAPLPSLEVSLPAVPRPGSYTFADIGFQRDESPVTDFRGLGMLAPVLLAGLLREPSVHRVLVHAVNGTPSDSGICTDMGYPFAIHVLNLAHGALDLLRRGALDAPLLRALARDATTATPARAAGLFWGWFEHTVQDFDQQWWSPAGAAVVAAYPCGVMAWPEMADRWHSDIETWLNQTNNEKILPAFSRRKTTLERFEGSRLSIEMAQIVAQAGLRIVPIKDVLAATIAHAEAEGVVAGERTIDALDVADVVADQEMA